MLKELDVCLLGFFLILTIETIQVCKRKWDCFEMSVVEIPSGGKLRVSLSLFPREGRKERDRKAIT